ncbi:MAG TPA: hypothetical protein VMW23_07700 [Sedimentisphaerales bacterium]|nr:hypothetical protein [Sedimentisphaerales bacterium]
MAVLVGIDEAGFGPILGPLIVSSCSFSVCPEMLESNLWQVLKASVGSKAKALAGRLLVTDSKKAYSKSRGIKHLQRTVLAFLKTVDKKPATLAQLLQTLCPDCLQRLNDYPWYKDLTGYDIVTNDADISIASNVLTDDMAVNGIKFLGFRTCCLDVAHYNTLMAKVKNKANVLFSSTSQLIKSAFDDACPEDLHIIVDRQGGRVHYRRQLQCMFGDMQLKILCENATVSSYELHADGRKMRLDFAVDADLNFLPVSLASMACKYLRELLVDCINRYFAQLCTNLKPTAGYWQDGQRFIRDLKTNMAHVRYDSNKLIRCR